jgi:hypothetical protein
MLVRPVWVFGTVAGSSQSFGAELVVSYCGVTVLQVHPG